MVTERGILALSIAGLFFTGASVLAVFRGQFRVWFRSWIPSWRFFGAAEVEPKLPLVPGVAFHAELRWYHLFFNPKGNVAHWNRSRVILQQDEDTS